MNGAPSAPPSTEHGSQPREKYQPNSKRTERNQRQRRRRRTVVTSPTAIVMILAGVSASLPFLLVRHYHHHHPYQEQAAATVSSSLLSGGNGGGGSKRRSGGGYYEYYAGAVGEALSGWRNSRRVDQRGGVERKGKDRTATSTAGGKNGRGGSMSGRRDDLDVLRRVMKRTSRHRALCEGIGSNRTEPVPTIADDQSRVTLPEFGVSDAIRSWLERNGDDGGEGGEMGEAKTEARQQCRLPPPTACHVEDYTVVLMSHTVERLSQLTEGIMKLSTYRRASEIVLVWNGDKAALETNDEYGKQLVSFHRNDTHPLRIFYAVTDAGLPNSLLNRYHPAIRPTREALLYFDDDGPFFPERAMDAGFELWRRNSGVEVGCFPRNVKFPTSERMNELQRVEMERSLAQVLGGWQADSPYDDEETIDEQEGKGERVNDPAKRRPMRQHPRIMPVCTSAELPQQPLPPPLSVAKDDGKDAKDPPPPNRLLHYNYQTFAEFYAHVLLPSGSILHRDWLCFVFHPAFEELRQYVLHHPTHPDDITISTLVSHLSGKAPRTFPRRVQPLPKEEKKKEEVDNGKKDRGGGPDAASSGNGGDGVNESGLKAGDGRRRRLLWQQQNWGAMRAEAVNDIVGYFGGINAGSVGWCAGGDAMEQNRRGTYQCQTPKPDLEAIPWMQEGGLGHDQCP